MKASTLKYGVLTWTLSLLSVIILLLPFHAFLTVWAASLWGHYTAFRLWKEFLLLPALLGVLYLLIFDQKVRSSLLKRKLTWVIAAYLLVQLSWAALALHFNTVSFKAAAYGVLLNSRFLIFFLLAWAVAVRTERLERRWPKLLLWPAVAVVGFGLLQAFVLPVDFLKHFGYGTTTIGPYETINHNLNYIRYFSTLRGANPFGAYLLLPISALVVLLLRYPKAWNWARGLLLGGSLIMLYFSFSRSAWIGAVLSVLAAVVATRPAGWLKRLHPAVWGGALAVVLALGAGAYALRNNTNYQNFVFHTQSNSSIKIDSNDAHASALQTGFKEVWHQPQGSGPGTAGPASFYNTKGPTRIAEDYYVQLAQETGWLGLALFLLILVGVARLLWQRRETALALSLLVSLIGISFIGLLSHVWTDDTLAYIWWGLAGLAIGTPVAPVVVMKSSVAKSARPKQKAVKSGQA